VTENILLCVGIIGLILQSAFVIAELVVSCLEWIDRHADEFQIELRIAHDTGVD
jgi:hypothetical protein